MKLPQIFTKTPNYKKFSYAPRFYDPKEEEQRERELRIRKELEEEKKESEEEKSDVNKVTGEYGHRQRIAGSFRNSKRAANTRPDTSASMLRLIILLILTVGLIAFLQFGTIALYGLAMIFVPVYLYSKFRNLTKK